MTSQAQAPRCDADAVGPLRDLTSALLGRRYVLRSQLGAGATSIVYAADDRLDDTLVAVKVVDTGTELNRARLLRELLAFAELAETSAPDFRGAVSSGSHTAIVMELVDGERLAEAVDACHGWRVAAALVRDVAEATSELHRRGVVHRDLTPLNIVTAPDAEVRILDYGSAWCRRWETLARPHIEAKGTPAFAAPEQLAGGPATPAADVYSIGTILLELLTARRDDLDATDADAVSMRRLSELVSSGRLPRAVLTTVEALRAPDPRQRPATAGDAQHVLERLLRSSGGGGSGAR